MNAGIFLFFIGYFCRKNDKKFFKTAIKVEGKVTAYKPGQIYNWEIKRYETVYYPIVSFYFNEESREVTDKNYSRYKPLMGQRRQVGINPQDFKDVRVYPGGNELMDWIRMILGVLFMLGGGFLSILSLILLLV